MGGVLQVRLQFLSFFFTSLDLFLPLSGVSLSRLDVIAPELYQLFCTKKVEFVSENPSIVNLCKSINTSLLLHYAIRALLGLVHGLLYQN